MRYACISCGLGLLYRAIPITCPKLAFASAIHCHLIPGRNLLMGCNKRLVDVVVLVDIGKS